MEFEKILSNPLYALPVGGVLLFALLVFMFGFKTPVEPIFIESEDRRKKAIKPKSKVCSYFYLQNLSLSTFLFQFLIFLKNQPKKKANADVEEKKLEKTKASPQLKSKSPAKSAAAEAAAEPIVKPAEPAISSKTKKQAKADKKSPEPDVAKPEDYDDGILDIHVFIFFRIKQ